MVERSRIGQAEIDREVTELSAMKWVAEQKSAVREEIDRLHLSKKLDEVASTASTTGITRKKGEIALSLISAAYASRFSAEIKRLGAVGVQVEIVPAGNEKGRVFHSLRLKGVKRPGPEEVLSHGEQQVVSLAAFLADSHFEGRVSPVVFDDPVTSLDDDYESYIARRLVALSCDRQVIVFTHRLTFLNAMEEAARKENYQITIQCLRQEFGIGSPGDLPIKKDNPKSALNRLNGELGALENKKEKKEISPDTYDTALLGICIQIRGVLERVVEKVLLSGIVQRYDKAVHTDYGLHRLVAIEIEDCRLIDDLMTRYSYEVHDQSEERSVRLPETETIHENIRRLLGWLKDFEERSEKQPR